MVGMMEVYNVRRQEVSLSVTMSRLCSKKHIGILSPRREVAILGSRIKINRWALDFQSTPCPNRLNIGGKPISQRIHKGGNLKRKHTVPN